MTAVEGGRASEQLPKSKTAPRAIPSDLSKESIGREGRPNTVLGRTSRTAGDFGCGPPRAEGEMTPMF